MTVTEQYPQPLRLNLGCGARKLAGWVNVDSQPMENPDVVLDIARDRWPFDDSSVDEAAAEHILEHLYPAGFMHFMKELHRVCRNGAKVKVLLPHPRHDIFLNDPTHVNPIMPATFFGFSKKHMEALAKRGMILTPHYKYLNVDFDLTHTQYWFEEGVDKDDPELEWKIKHLNNIVFQWGTTLTAVK